MSVQNLETECREGMFIPRHTLNGDWLKISPQYYLTRQQNHTILQTSQYACNTSFGLKQALGSL